MWVSIYNVVENLIFKHVTYITLHVWSMKHHFRVLGNVYSLLIVVISEIKLQLPLSKKFCRIETRLKKNVYICFNRILQWLNLLLKLIVNS